VSTTEAQLYEIFSSVQGEGILLGVRQIFIRTLMCNLSCAYCDSTEALIPQKTFKVEQTPGKKDFVVYNNPATIPQIIGFIEHFNKPKDLHHSVSLTGGEPLLQVDFLKNLIPEIKKTGLKIYLETNGTLHDRLKEIIDLVDHIAMDVKLPSVTGMSDMLGEHKKTLEVAVAKDVFVKMVVGKTTKSAEVDAAAKMIAEVNPLIPLVIQPVTPIRDIKHGPLPDQLLLFHTMAKRHLDDVRIIPQTHKLMGHL
jgi:7-carboxy-7-deazaguanine synthase